MVATLDTTPREQALNTALHEVLDENEALRAENVRLQGRLDAMASAFDANGTLGVLQKMAHDGDLKPELRVKAAGLAVAYERPRPAGQTNVSFKLFDYLENDRLKKMAAADAAKTIEHQPGTVLGEGQGHHGAWHPLDSDKGDPAA
jgi:hypothetical protein